MVAPGVAAGAAGAVVVLVACPNDRGDEAAVSTTTPSDARHPTHGALSMTGRSRLTLLSRRSPVLTARRTAERRAQECAVAATAHLDRVPYDADWLLPDLRRGRRRLYG